MGIGGIGSITSASRMQATQITASDLKDQKSKNLQDDISDVQREIQKLSSESDLSVSEKAEKKEKLQEEKSNLDTKLKLHQDELLKSQKREIKLAELQEDRKPAAEETAEDNKQVKEASSNIASDTADEKKLPADDRRNLQPGTIITQNSDGTVILKEILNQDTENDTDAQNAQAETQGTQAESRKEEAAADDETKAAEEETPTDTGLSAQDVQAMVSADVSMQQADRQGALVTKSDGDIGVLKSEIKLDELRDADTEGKQAELKDLQEQNKREMGVQFSLLGEAERSFQVSGVNASQEDQALQQGFQVSIA